MVCERRWTSREVGNDTQEGGWTRQSQLGFHSQGGQVSAGSDGIVCLCEILNAVRWGEWVSPRAVLAGERNTTRLSLIQ